MKNMLKTMQDLLEEYYESFGMERAANNRNEPRLTTPA